MKKEIIEIWLNGKRDYSLGIEIYNRFGDDDFLKNMFAEADDEWNRERLLEELKALLLMDDYLPTPIVRNMEVEHKFDGIKPSELPNAPDPIKEAIKQRKGLYKEARDAHAQLKALRLVPGNEFKEKRRHLSKLILQNFDLIKPLWDLTNHYDHFLRLPEKPVSESTDYTLMSEAELNQLWLKQYKYCQKWKADKTKWPQLQQRVQSNLTIKNILADAFLYAKHCMPDIPATATA